jgi:hypothetical protein
LAVLVGLDLLRRNAIEAYEAKRWPDGVGAIRFVRESHAALGRVRVKRGPAHALVLELLRRVVAGRHRPLRHTRGPLELLASTV